MTKYACDVCETVEGNINRMSFTLENVERTREGNQYFNVGPDEPFDSTDLEKSVCQGNDPD